MKFGPTPWQTVGPFFGPALVAPGLDVLADSHTRGQRIFIEGQVLDGDRSPVPDALIEIWQANAVGCYDHPEDPRQDKALDPAFHGFGRAGTDKSGCFRFATIKPGPVPGVDGGLQAPHINVSLFARGLLRRLTTRIYFPYEELNASDPVLKLLPEPRRASLIVKQVAKGRFRFDILLQGDDETVFLEI
jgi:protocatechuate 3,4-dioxygenase alpha subunit